MCKLDDKATTIAVVGFPEGWCFQCRFHRSKSRWERLAVAYRTNMNTKWSWSHIGLHCIAMLQSVIGGGGDYSSTILPPVTEPSADFFVTQEGRRDQQPHRQTRERAEPRRSAAEEDQRAPGAYYIYLQIWTAPGLVSGLRLKLGKR